VRIVASRPLSKLKRWRLKEIVRKAALVPEHTAAEVKA
jgi:ribosomal protein S17